MAKMPAAIVTLCQRNQYLVIFKGLSLSLPGFQCTQGTQDPYKDLEVDILLKATWIVIRSLCHERYMRGSTEHHKICNLISISCHHRGSILGKLCGFMWIIIINPSDSVEFIWILVCSTVSFRLWPHLKWRPFVETNFLLKITITRYQAYLGQKFSL